MVAAFVILPTDIGSLLGKLICSGKSGRAISQTLGVEMPTIRQYCRGIHGKIGTHSRLAIGLWAIREGMMKSAVQPEPR
jgi:DNA-binding NarL/FixJ family response regulator